jgi:hypothetical protein
VAKPNKGRVGRIEGMDVVAWMRREGWIQSGLGPRAAEVEALGGVV